MTDVALPSATPPQRGSLAFGDICLPGVAPDVQSKINKAGRHLTGSRNSHQQAEELSMKTKTHTGSCRTWCLGHPSGYIRTCMGWLGSRLWLRSLRLWCSLRLRYPLRRPVAPVAPSCTGGKSVTADPVQHMRSKTEYAGNSSKNLSMAAWLSFIRRLSFLLWSPFLFALNVCSVKADCRLLKAGIQVSPPPN